jgi:hypothetical protein
MMEEANYADEKGVIMPVGLTLMDAGWRTQAIYDACHRLGLDWRPAMGFGKSSGCVQASFTAPIHSTADKKSGDHWFLSRRPKSTWLVCMDADFWKSWEHDRWRTDPQKHGSMMLFGSAGDDPKRLSMDQKGHLTYANHIVAEAEVEDVVKGVLKRFWRAKSDSNHFLDASYMSDVAASMLGLKVARTQRAAVIVDAAEWYKK